MGEFLFALAELAAVIVFIVALVQGKGFWNAVRMGVGVMVLGLVAAVAITILAFGLAVVGRLLMLALWVALIYALVIVVAKVLRGPAM